MMSGPTESHRFVGLQEITYWVDLGCYIRAFLQELQHVAIWRDLVAIFVGVVRTDGLNLKP